MQTVLEPINILPGVEPASDRKSTTTQHYTFTKGIRFKDGFPEKIGGWESLTFDGFNSIAGAPRSIFSYNLDGYARYMVGTNSKLYGLFGTALTNITPLETTGNAIANSLDTFYGTLVNNPIATVSGSTTVTISDAGHKMVAGDTVVLSGATSVNGIPAGDFNTDHFVRSTSANSYTIIVATAATSSGSGGGASVVRATGVLTVNAASHGLGDGARVKISGAADTGGILAAEINREFVIRNTQTNTFDIVTAGTATSSVAGGGGASTQYFKEIVTGNVDTLVGNGYGLGLYGVGLYGVSKTSSNTFPPRIWSHDRFGDLVIATPGNGGKLYSWDSDTAAAPSIVANAPPAVNYVFESNGFVVVLGYDTTGGGAAKDNGISWNAAGQLTNWTTQGAGGDSIEGAGKLISQANARGTNLLWTENQTYTMRFIGGQFIWQFRRLDPSVGLIAQNARVSARGNIYWMGLNNLYQWRGGGVEIMRSNSGPECTALDYVFKDFNFGQKEKTFAWFNEEYSEVWWHYPSANSNEPDRVLRVDVNTYVWTIDELGRTAAEYPSVITSTPYLINRTGTLYLHENGTDDDGSPLDWQLVTNYIYGGTDTIQISALVPDQQSNSDFDINVKTLHYPNGVVVQNESYVITPTTERLPTEQNGRFWQIALSGSALGQTFTSGQWYQEIKRSTPK